MEDQTDFAIKAIARAYARFLSAVKSNSPIAAGNSAQQQLLVAIRQQGGTAIKSEPRTGVDSAGGGQSRFDFLFNLNNTDIYLEVQASGYHHGHKPDRYAHFVDEMRREVAIKMDEILQPRSGKVPSLQPPTN